MLLSDSNDSGSFVELPKFNKQRRKEIQFLEHLLTFTYNVYFDENSERSWFRVKSWL